MKRDIQFSETKLIGSMREALAHARGKLMLKTTRVPNRANKTTSRPDGRRRNVEAAVES